MFHEHTNKEKPFDEKRIIVLSDYSSNVNDEAKLEVIRRGLSKQSIRVDFISPFGETEEKQEEKERR